MGMAAASSAPDLTVLPDAPPPPPPPRSLVYGSSMRTCAVCLEDYLPGDRLRMLEPCNHCFHQNCIDAWLQPLQPPLRKPLCPVCNATVSLPCVPDLPASPTAWPTVQLIDLSVHQSWLQWFVDLLNLYYQPHTASS
ncbi:E3 ubiquitin-protein ligase ATL23 [Gracilariopsis chorda]|uniref:E3 ubiquitin-protein ligase ATL23 n=1 Tax=Gracilariopsis chorda TaxID=448386 RepID=A0A2V3J3I3_9FLOR|nr:E3 ubiquitin-protein ligase ATL23 [Gracilariopsis chorda]|eukprot:PXF48929.1 E3 ubiquitin-protein ligase ATL23 [Gracilariopsis chorda]